ncbi:MAG: 3'-5' exonuclease [Cytophagales bacterium]|nr:3'-5' exonuclease [Cytophagales bacterium]
MDYNTYLQVKDILFLDIETVTNVPNFETLETRGKKLWERKSKYFQQKYELSLEESFQQKAGLFAEFSKIITISIGYFVITEQEEFQLRIKTFAGENEKEILSEFKTIIEEKFNQKILRLCSHNGKEFDFPFLCRRLLINKISLPQTLKIQGKKPWDIPHLDTLEMWKFGDRSMTSLETLSYIFGIPSSKQEMDGSMVSKVYYEEADPIPKIARYCESDVIVTAQVYLAMQCLPLVDKEQIIRTPLDIKN